ncbi:endonuclease/exonuclease/phosphatase family protein [uncultured Flavobacterium sp.]|uniref:endonuclease/exonuclease/phosphatase family protein n=1 Tax=uncultured Flavobacterium sp. TaxID=165435 RepID=UPI0034574502
MKIGTINIDWFKKSLDKKKHILEEIKAQDFDFLIVTENLEEFEISEKYSAYHSNKIPLDRTFQYLDYQKYLNGKQAIRTSIYSKIPSIKKNKTSDGFTSVCHTFKINDKEITIYGTIIGTWGIKYQKEIAKKELLDFISDIDNLAKENVFLILAGDFNTSFDSNEMRQLVQINSREVLKSVTEEYGFERTTENIKDNIDHIFFSKSIKSLEPYVWFSDIDLKDGCHKGIGVNFEF